MAAMTDGFSAADLQAVCSDAQLESVHNFLAHKETMASVESAAKPVITMQNLQTAARNARPSVPDSERRKLNSVYASFMEMRKPTSSKVCRWYFCKKISHIEPSVDSPSWLGWVAYQYILMLGTSS